MAYLGKTPSQAVRNRFKFTASGGETSLSGADANGNTLVFTDGGYTDVYLNGVYLVQGSDYNVNTANTIAGLTALSANDIVEIIVYDTFAVFDGNFQGNLDVGGNIVVSGTVDGRDVAADGTKLDGIEASATADQTAAEIRTLVESASDSNVFTDADHTKLNGIEASADVTDTANVVSALTAGNNITIANNGTISTIGGATGIDFNDNVKARFGTGNDLEIFHNSINSIIEGKTGDLILRTAGTESIFLQDAGGNSLAQFNDNSDVKLYHNANEKLATNSSGIAITGGFTATDGSTITTADNTTQLTLTSTDDDNDIGPQLDLRRDSSSPADGDVLGRVRWLTDDDAGNMVESAILQSNLEDASQGTVDTQLQISTSVASTMRNRMKMTSSEVVFNEGSFDSDFRIESDGNTSMFFLDGGNNTVGIGTNAATNPLTVRGNGGTGATAAIRWRDESDQGATFGVFNSGNVVFNAEQGNFLLNFGGTGKFTFESGGDLDITDGNLKVASGHGIDFSATSNGGVSTPNELLDDYEEGTWTAQMLGTSSNPSNTVLATTATYTKIGSLVWAGATFVGVNTTGASGGVTVTGMPFNSNFTIPMGNVMSQNTFNVGNTVANITPFWANGTTIMFYHTLHGSNIWGAVHHSAGTSRYLYLSLIYTTNS